MSLVNRMLQGLALKLNFIAYPALLTYWHVRRPRTTGVHVLLRYHGQVLLVRHSYGTKRWTVPGGGVKQVECLEAAARREIREEVGVALDHLVKHGRFSSTVEGKRDTAWVFSADVQDDRIHVSSWEILEARWVSIDDVCAGNVAVSYEVHECLALAGYGPATLSNGA